MVFAGGANPQAQRTCRRSRSSQSVRSDPGRCQTLSVQGHRRIGQCHAASDECGQEPVISGCGGSVEGRSRHSQPGRTTSVQVSQQCNRTGPPHSEETRVAGEGVWFLFRPPGGHYREPKQYT